MEQDRRLPAALIELDSLERQIRESLARWRVMAVTSMCLESVREVYEKERQPATLAESSRYLQQMTGGRYGRIWTPLDEETLLVDDAHGRPRRLEVLSTGTREQVFLSIRLALVSLYARRGAVLPLVLDDVLVNFDQRRARAAARVLCEFAAEGHQLLLFTCHEHIAHIFQSLEADVRQLPAHSADFGAEFDLPLDEPREEERSEVVQVLNVVSSEEILSQSADEELVDSSLAAPEPEPEPVTEMEEVVEENPPPREPADVRRHEWQVEHWQNQPAPALAGVVSGEFDESAPATSTDAHSADDQWLEEPAIAESSPIGEMLFGED